ncbi:lipocalin family protein [Maribacter aestuarii]|uniref:lipocalin family protein n=1 Tax=Maribacter aestuarii TaxID=1130723 RepID=UPI00248BB0F5|nr:lipocalin family protein [Maribacter aestuarii]
MAKFYLLFSVLLLLFSCSKDEDGKDLEDASLEGSWVLTNVSCFCGFPEDNDFTETLLLFDTEENKVTVDNRGKYEYFKPSGTYSYNGEDNRIKFEDGRNYRFEINKEILNLIFMDEPNIADDEITYTLEREQ